MLIHIPASVGGLHKRSRFILTPIGHNNKLSSGDAFNHSNFNWPSNKRFLTELRTAFTREMNWRYLTAAHLHLLAFSMADSMLQIEALEEKFKYDDEIEPGDEMGAFSIKKKFVLALGEVESIVWGEREKLDSIATVLASKPDWLSPEETKEAIEDLRAAVSLFFTTFDSMRTTGQKYLFAGRFLQEFPQHNRIFKHSAEMKTIFAQWSLELKKGLPFMCRLLKEVRKRWSWLSDEEKQASLERLRIRHEEKVKVKNERREARLAHNRFLRKIKLARREAYKNKAAGLQIPAAETSDDE